MPKLPSAVDDPDHSNNTDDDVEEVEDDDEEEEDEKVIDIDPADYLESNVVSNHCLKLCVLTCK